MTKPPIDRLDQSGYQKTGLRLPPDLHAEIKAAAEIAGRSMNAEIVARLQRSTLDDIARQNEEMKSMLRQVLDIVREKL